ncbi:hypothetical protein [Actinomadura rugatobispora]|uniref:Zinc-ribbon domain-containing protein n=1 Tax=Actinomadura rugatobispora TaxID=1994 RepID=A0ABW1A3H4_9ACTN|nr:hypothetical protein GCM10010200_038720 [Actinomadura rugatobispora]
MDKIPIVHGDDGGSPGECPKGGEHSMDWANGAAYCTKCLATF